MSSTPPRPTSPAFCTVIQGRHPRTKMHAHLHLAKVALQQPQKTRTGPWVPHKKVAVEGRSYPTYIGAVCGGQLYRWDTEANDWVLLYDVPMGTYQDELPWLAEELSGVTP